jgi:hypothetical protein
VLLFDEFFGFVLLALWIYCIFDVVTTDDSLVRNLPKLMWLVIVVILPDIGSVIWLVAGRPHGASFRTGDTGYGHQSRRPMGPEDRSDYSPLVRERDEWAELRMREEQLRRREEELRRRELAAGVAPEDPPPPKPQPPSGD